MIQDLAAWLDDILGGRFIGPLETYGVNLSKFITQSIIWLIPTIWASVHVIRHRTGIRLAGWMILILLIPIIGALLALIFVRSPEQQKC
jgi:hypothetical protein